MNYDVGVIGGGPVGCVTALAFAKKGAKVLLLEANPRACERLAGEWLHPPAVQILDSLGVELGPEVGYQSGRGFVVFPDDGSREVVLPYRQPAFGMSIEHNRLVAQLRARCEEHVGVEYMPYTRGTRITGQNLSYERRAGLSRTAAVGLIVGASGRASVAHSALGIDKHATSYSRMAGLLLENADLPFEGYGHVFLGGPGPVLAYKIDHQHTRVCLDVPLSMRVHQDKAAVLWDAYAQVFPKQSRPAFLRALKTGAISWAANQIRARVEFGREGLALVGDAVGHHHPLTAVGMTLGFQDAVALAKAKSVAAYRRERVLKSRVPEMLAVALYEVFADLSDETVSMRRAVYELWRTAPHERLRTMGFLAGLDSNPLRFGTSFVRAVLVGSKSLARDGLKTGRLDHVLEVGGDLADRIRWMAAGTLHFSLAEPTKEFSNSVEDPYGAALKAASAKAEIVEHPSALELVRKRKREQVEPRTALQNGAEALLALQGEDGSWEGEVAWCPALAAQYVITCKIIDQPISAERRRRLLKHFEVTQLDKSVSGVWGLHSQGDAHLSVTALVYVAARLLGVGKEDPLLVQAHEFIKAQGGVLAIPSWGKLWLAMLNLYDWEGKSPVLPEAFELPKWLPVHPSRYHSHTRLIYMGMAAIYGARYQMPMSALLRELRDELYPQGYEQVDFSAAPSIGPPKVARGPLRAARAAAKWLEKMRGEKARTRSIDELLEHIRYELRTTNHTSISPVSGLLNIIALWISEPSDQALKLALERLEGWIWEDEEEGTRVTGARSATWDTALAISALSFATEHLPERNIEGALRKGRAFLKEQQVKSGIEQHDAHYRIDPVGGYCFAGAWHGWPVSDATAEAMLARLTAKDVERDDMIEAARFILRTQNKDGGFGSYEARRPGLPLEWLNIPEVFGASERSYVECTASCIAALVRFKSRYPRLLKEEIERALDRAKERLRLFQNPDGAWEGALGVHYIHGTLFGVRGLLAAGVAPQDPDIRKACLYLKARQRSDGGWGEHYKSGEQGAYVEAEEGHVTQTAWALITLLLAKDPDWEAIDRAARFLSRKQLDTGDWPKTDPVGVFLRMAVSDYRLYKNYFPIWALSMYESRRLERLGVIGEQEAGALSG